MPIVPKLRIGAAGLAIAAAALAVYSVFQPAFESGEIEEIYGNTLLQKGTGWLIVACAAGIVVSTCLYRLRPRRATAWAMIVAALGMLILGAKIYQTTGGRDALEGGNDLLLLVWVFHGTPAAGIREAEAAGALAVLSGLILAFLSLLPRGRADSRISGVAEG